MKKLKMNMRYLMQLRQSPSMAVLLTEAPPCPFGHKTRRSSEYKSQCVKKAWLSLDTERKAAALYS